MFPSDFDLIIIGAGITGAGLFQQASALGLKTLILDKGAAGRQTTGASSGLIHGGLRYLTHDVGTSILCCRQAGELRRRYPDLLRRQVFLWVLYDGDPHGIELVESLLEYYDEFAPLKEGKLHTRLSSQETLSLEPRLNSRGLQGAVSFDEWAVDPVALVRRLLDQGRENGGSVLEEARVRRFAVAGSAISSLTFTSSEGTEHAASARVVVNAAGPWAESVAGLAGARMVRLSLRKGVHLILNGPQFPLGLIFSDNTGRHIGLYPRGAQAWIGPTDDPYNGELDFPIDTEDERQMLRQSIRKIFPAMESSEIQTAVGLRPILRQNLPGPLSRDYRVFDHSREGLNNFITVTGGKLTSFHPMAEETLRLALHKLGNPKPPAARAVAANRLQPQPLFFWRNRFFSMAASILFLIRHIIAHLVKNLRGGGRRGIELFKSAYPEISRS